MQDSNFFFLICRCKLNAKCQGEGSIAAKWIEFILDNSIEIQMRELSEEMKNVNNFDFFERKFLYDNEADFNGHVYRSGKKTLL